MEVSRPNNLKVRVASVCCGLIGSQVFLVQVLVQRVQDRAGMLRIGHETREPGAPLQMMRLPIASSDGAYLCWVKAIILWLISLLGWTPLASGRHMRTYGV